MTKLTLKIEISIDTNDEKHLINTENHAKNQLLELLENYCTNCMAGDVYTQDLYIQYCRSLKAGSAVLEIDGQVIEGALYERHGN